MADTQRSVKLRIVADAGTAKETLDDIKAKYDDLNGKDATLRVRANTSNTKEELDEIGAKAEALGFKRVTFTVKADTKEAEAEIDSLRLKLAKLAIEESAAEAAGGLLRTGLMALAPAVIPIGAAAAAVGGALLPALAAGGVGLGVFAVAAKGAVTQIEAADKANKKLTGGLGEMQTQLNTAKSDWQLFISQSADGIGHTLAPALSIIPKALQYMRQFLAPAEQGLHVLATQFKSAFESTGAQNFVQQLAGMVTPAIISLGDAAGHVLHGIGGLFKDLMPHAGNIELLINKIAGDFDRWANSTSAANGIQGFFNYVNQVGPKIGAIIKELGQDIPKIVSAFKAWGAASLGGISVILTVIGKMSPGQLQLIAGGILAIRAATMLWKLAVVGLNAVSDLNPWIIALTAVIAVVLLVVKYHKQLEAAVQAALKAITSAWDSALNAIKGAFDAVSKFISQKWNAIRSGASIAIGNLISLFRGIPGRIVNALSALGSMMWNIGVNIIWGVIRGVEAEAGQLFSYIRNIASSIGNVFSWALSIFSPSRVFWSHGKNIILGLLGGLKESAPQVTGFISDLGKSVSGSLDVSTTAGGRAGVAARGGTVTIAPQVTVTGIVGDAGATGREVGKALNEYLRQTGQAQLVGF